MSGQPQRLTADYLHAWRANLVALLEARCRSLMSYQDSDIWKAYWSAQDMPWRTEPEVSTERQRFLTERRTVQADIKHGIYPFRDENGSIKLTRADVEWLLATHESGGMHGPVQWEEEKDKPEDQRREGLDVRGADLGKVNLRGLPLALLRAGLKGRELFSAAPQEAGAATAHLEGALLFDAHLEGLNFEVRTSKAPA